MIEDAMNQTSKTTMTDITDHSLCSNKESLVTKAAEKNGPAFIAYFIAFFACFLF